MGFDPGDFLHWQPAVGLLENEPSKSVSSQLDFLSAASSLLGLSYRDFISIVAAPKVRLVRALSQGSEVGKRRGICSNFLTVACLLTCCLSLSLTLKLNVLPLKPELCSFFLLGEIGERVCGYSCARMLRLCFSVFHLLVVVYTSASSGAHPPPNHQNKLCVRV